MFNSELQALTTTIRTRTTLKNNTFFLPSSHSPAAKVLHAGVHSYFTVRDRFCPSPKFPKLPSWPKPAHSKVVRAGKAPTPSVRTARAGSARGTGEWPGGLRTAQDHSLRPHSPRLTKLMTMSASLRKALSCGLGSGGAGVGGRPPPSAPSAREW